jgi:hypothetical protein
MGATDASVGPPLLRLATEVATDAATGATNVATGATDASVGPPLLRLAMEVATDAVVLSTRHVCRSIS